MLGSESRRYLGGLNRNITIKTKPDVLKAYKCPLCDLTYATGKNIFSTSIWNIMDQQNFSCD